MPLTPYPAKAWKTRGGAANGEPDANFRKTGPAPGMGVCHPLGVRQRQYLGLRVTRDGSGYQEFPFELPGAWTPAPIHYWAVGCLDGRNRATGSTAVADAGRSRGRSF